MKNAFRILIFISLLTVLNSCEQAVRITTPTEDAKRMAKEIGDAMKNRDYTRFEELQSETKAMVNLYIEKRGAAEAEEFADELSNETSKIGN